MALRRWSAALLAAILVSACGGGGGGGGDGGGGGGGGGFSISFDRNHVEASFAEDAGSTDVTVIATAHGTPSGDVFVGASTPSGAADPNIEQVNFEPQGSTGAIVHIVPKAGLARGRYTGTLLLLACADENCAKHYTGSPFSLSYTFVVTAGLRVSPQAVYFDADTGSAQSENISVALPDGVSSFTATANDSWATIDQLTTSGFRVSVPARAAGTYSTTIEVVAGTYRRTISVTQTVPPRRVKVDKTSVSLNAASGTPASTAVAVTQLGEGATDFTVSAEGAPWLSVGDISAGAFKINTTTMPSGTYRGEIWVRSGTDALAIPVTYTVTPPAGGDKYLDVKARSVTLSAFEGGVSAKQSIGLTRPSWNPDVKLEVSYNNGSGWITSTAGPDGDVLLSANAVGLAQGVYQATVTVTGAYPNSGFGVPVTFTVGAGLTAPAPRSVLIDSESTAASLKGSIPVTSNGTAALNWTASSSQPWLRLTRSSGSLGSTIDYEIDTALALALPAYTDVPATITINASASGAPAGAAGVTPVTTSLTLRRELAELSFAGPGNVVSGQGNTIFVRGRGFDRLSDPAARLTIGGVTPTSVSRVSATSLRVTLPAMSAGDKTIAIGNALGVATDTAKLHVLDPQTYVAKGLSTGGVPGAVLHDPLRRQIFVLNTTLGSIQRFRESAGVWTSDVLALAGLDNIGLSPDGSVLVATAAAGTLYLIDPAAFTVSDTFGAPGPFNSTPATGHGLAITNDGKVWLTVGTGWNDMVTFDLKSHVFTVVRPASVPADFYYGPWYEVSRNGERLAVVQSASISPQPPLLYMDASQGTWRVNPAGITFFYWSLNGLDDTGSRLAVFGQLYDASFANVGSAVIPDAGWSQSAAVLSPDGKRYYVYSLPPDWQNAATPVMPRVYVFDASVAAGTVANLPLLGKFDLQEYATCHADSYTSECYRPQMNVSADGRTLFIAGSVKLLVVPVPTLTPAVGGRRGPVMQRWISK